MDKEKAEKELKRLEARLEKLCLYPMWHPILNGSAVYVPCREAYCTKTKYFSRHPRSDAEEKLMQTYAYLLHWLYGHTIDPQDPIMTELNEKLMETKE